MCVCVPARAAWPINKKSSNRPIDMRKPLSASVCVLAFILKGDTARLQVRGGAGGCSCNALAATRYARSSWGMFLGMFLHHLRTWLASSFIVDGLLRSECLKITCVPSWSGGAWLGARVQISPMQHQVGATANSSNRCPIQLVN